MKVSRVKPVVWTLVVSLSCMIVLVVGGIWYTNYVADRAEERLREATARAIAESNRQWCDIVLLFDTTYKQQPPATPTGKTLAAFFANRRITFGCN